MTNLTAWSAGVLASGSIGWTAAFGASDMNSLPALDAVLSTVSFDNSSGQAQFMDVSFIGAYAAAQTIPAGACMAFYLYMLQGDGATIGDGRLVAGTQTIFQPILNPIGGTPFQVGPTITNLAGTILSFCLPPGVFRLVAFNQAGFVLAASANQAYIRLYRQNTNS
jgi:hypothetical protein